MKAGDSAQGGEAVAALYFRTVTLVPGESCRYQIVMTIDDDPAPYLTPEGVAEALTRTTAFWQPVSALKVHTQNQSFDAWIKWVGIQPTLRRICGYSFQPHHDYGQGWRDLWQDSLALLLTNPAEIRGDLLSFFAGVRTDGTNATIIGTKPGEFKADRNGIPRVWMDHGFWPLLTVELYLNETGDLGFLLENAPYFRDTLPHREEGMEEVRMAQPLGRLLEAPWGDYKNMVSSLLAYCREMEHSSETVTISGKALAETLRFMSEYLKTHIRRGEWVGDGADQQARQIIRAADWYLRDSGRGGYCLNTDFHEVKLDMGRMFGFSYGSKENGAVFCHMAVMYAYALYSRGFREAGWWVLEDLYDQSADFSRSKILPGIPEYFDERGQGMYPYLTGFGSWLLLTLQTQVFGVRGKNGDLMLEPKLLPCHFDGEGIAEIRCTSAGHKLLVRYRNPQGLSEYRIGKVVCGDRIWEVNSKSIVIPGDALPGDDLITLDVALVDET